MTAGDILRLLAERHEDDVFVPECKDGDTMWRGRHLRLDAWVMKKSWAHPRVIGYEIKVSRSDFLQDDKWTGYLPLCNEFWFVAPAGVLDPREIPQDVGLLTVTKTGTKLYTKRKAVWRDVQIPESLFRYILMSRAEIIRERALETRQDKGEYWRKWLARKTEYKELGFEVSKKIQDFVRTANSDVQKMKLEVARLEAVRDALKSLGFDPGRAAAFDVNEELRTRTTGLTAEMVRNLRRSNRAIESLLEIVGDQ